MGTMPCWVSVCACSKWMLPWTTTNSSSFLPSEFSRSYFRSTSTVTLAGDEQQDNNSELAVFALERYRVSQFLRNASSPSIC